MIYIFVTCKLKVLLSSSKFNSDIHAPFKNIKKKTLTGYLYNFGT